MATRKQEYYLVEEVAEKLRVSNMTIYRYIKASKLHAHKIGKEYRIARSDFEQFMQSVKN